MECLKPRLAFLSKKLNLNFQKGGINNYDNYNNFSFSYKNNNNFRIQFFLIGKYNNFCLLWFYMSFL